MKTLEFIDLILKSTAQSGISLTQDQARLFSIHIELLLRWNTRLNLTRITRIEDIIVKHLLDSILPLKFLPSAGNALDVGTGAGFPGIPLKIFCPGLQMILLDSSRKKVSFLANVAAALGMQGIRAVHGRWQELAKTAENTAKLQLITMRAVKLEPQHITFLASVTLAPGGYFAWWGGCSPDLEAGDKGCGTRPFEEKCGNVEFVGAYGYALPGVERQRAVWIWKKPESADFHLIKNGNLNSKNSL
jgi:16S rRNA (guanine527-N7)-methyltransferase